MEAAIKITVVDPDDYYLGVEIRAWTRRYSGGTRVFVGDDLEALSQFCVRISGFPARGDDDRESQFGTTASGGYCRLRFRTLDAVGHAVVDVELEDDISLYSDASAKFSFRVDAAAVDRFIQELRDVVRDRIGEAVLEGSV